MNRAETIAMLLQHCKNVVALAAQVDLEATRKKADGECRRLVDLKDWCEQAELATVTADYANACRVLQIIEAFQRIVRDYKEGIA